MVSKDYGTTDKIQNLHHFPIPEGESILMVPLGGVDRVGMNFTLYGTGGRWILVDMGATFPGAGDDMAADFGEHHEAEIESIVLDPRGFQEVIKRLDGIVLTHAHEDHIGAMGPLLSFSDAWPRLANVPIYGTPYTLTILKRKLVERGLTPTVRCMSDNAPTKIGPFSVTPVRVTHSIPNTSSLHIACKAGAVVHASDYKLDTSPILGPTTNLDKLERIGAAGVLAFMGDSTNAGLPGRSRSEAEVAHGITEAMHGRTGRVVVSTFGSHIERIESVRVAAKANGRLLGAAGHSLLRNHEAARETGVISKSTEPFINLRRLPHSFDKSRVAMVCTGSQAEERAILRRMADDLEFGTHDTGIGRLEKGDLVIHSARAIPGNEGAIGAMFDVFRAHGVDVMEPNSKTLIHASGHARRDEISDMYRLLRPRFAVPIHGDRQLIAAHADLAHSTPGVEAVSTPKEGEIVRISQAGIELIGRVVVKQLAVMRGVGASLGEEKLAPWPSGHSKVLTRLQSKPQMNMRPARRERENQASGPRM